jgi:ketosteroid isomerase-like protein
MLGVLDQNIEVIPPKQVPGVASVYYGHEGFLEFLGEWFEPWDEYAVEIEELIDAGDRVITVERHMGHRKETGVEVTQQVSAVWTIRGGATTGMRVFLDKRDAFRSRRAVGVGQASDLLPSARKRSLGGLRRKRLRHATLPPGSRDSVLRDTLLLTDRTRREGGARIEATGSAAMRSTRWRSAANRQRSALEAAGVRE